MAELLRLQGYGATSLQQLAKAAGAPIGSIYHHFRGGKREVAAAALRESGAAYIQLLPLLLDQNDDLPAAIDAAFAAAADDMANTGWANMCPVGIVAGEIADTEPELRQVTGEVIASWVDEGSRYLAGRGLSPADARTAMYALLTAIEGAFLLARAQHSVEPLLAAGRAASAYIATLPVAARLATEPDSTCAEGSHPDPFGMKIFFPNG